MNRNTLYYSDELISSVKEMVNELADSIDKQTIMQREVSYLRPNAQIARIKRDVLAIPQIKNMISKDSKILEIGSGIGTSCLVMKSITNAEIVGVEPAPKSYSGLHKCIKTFAECNKHLSYTICNCGGENIPFPDEYFDFIYSFEVMEHVQDPQKVFREIYRLLKPNGCAYIATCNYDSFYEGHYQRFWNPLIGVEGNRKKYIKKGLSSRFLEELNFITKRKINIWCQEAGFTKIEYNPYAEPANSNERMNVVYPDGYMLPNVNRLKSHWLQILLEKKIVNILSKFDREYKLYFLLSK